MSEINPGTLIKRLLKAKISLGRFFIWCIAIIISGLVYLIYYDESIIVASCFAICILLYPIMFHVIRKNGRNIYPRGINVLFGGYMGIIFGIICLLIFALITSDDSSNSPIIWIFVPVLAIILAPLGFWLGYGVSELLNCIRGASYKKDVTH